MPGMTSTDTGEEAPEMELEGSLGESDADIAEGTDVPEGNEVEDQMAEEALAGTQQAASQQPAPQQGFPINEFAASLKEALAPLVPKPPVEKKWWDDPKTMRENMLRDPEKFHKGLNEYTDHKVQTAIAPLHDAMGKMFNIVQHLMASAQQKPEFSSASTKAAEIAKKYGIDYNTALRMQLDNGSKPAAAAAGNQAQSGKKVRVPPGHASAPDTSQSTSRVTSDKGPADFASIVKSLRGAGRK